MCEHDLVKVAVRGHVGVHGGLSYCSRPQELSSVFVIHDSVTTIHWALKYDPARLTDSSRPLSRSCNKFLVFVRYVLAAVRSADPRGGL